jgi:hypothetical protein
MNDHQKYLAMVEFLQNIKDNNERQLTSVEELLIWTSGRILVEAE